MISRIGPRTMGESDAKPVVWCVAFVALQGSNKVITRLTGCGTAIVATGAGAGSIAMVKGGSGPTVGVMAVITSVATRYMVS